MIEQRCRGIYQSVTPRDHLKECREVFTILCRGTRSKGRVESASTIQECLGKGHICAGAKASRSVRVQGRPGVIFPHIVDTAGKTLVKPPELLEPELCRGLKLQWQDESSNAAHIIGNAEASDQLDQPVRIDYHIVIRKRQNLSPGRHSATIMCPGKAWMILTYIAHLRYIPIGLLDKISRCTRTRSIVHDNDFKMRIMQGQQGTQARRDPLRAVMSWDDDTYERSVREKAFALLDASSSTRRGQTRCIKLCDHWQAILLQMLDNLRT